MRAQLGGEIFIVRVQLNRQFPLGHRVVRMVGFEVCFGEVVKNNRVVFFFFLRQKFDGFVEGVFGLVKTALPVKNPAQAVQIRAVVRLVA